MNLKNLCKRFFERLAHLSPQAVGIEAGPIIVVTLTVDKDENQVPHEFEGIPVVVKMVKDGMKAQEECEE